MKDLKIYFNLFALLALLVGCQNEDYSFGELVAPSSVEIDAMIQGQSEESPYGDGSGVVLFKVKADDAITYRYVYGEKEVMAPSGEIEFIFSNTGIEVYQVQVVAIGTGGSTSTKVIEVEVLVEYEAPADLLAMLHGDSQRTWRVEAETPGHFGVGPGDSESPSWYSAAPNEKEGLGMYDDRITFFQDGSLYYDTMGDIFGKSYAIDPIWGDKGQEANGDDEYSNYPLDPFSDSWYISAPGGAETINFNGNASAGFFVGAQAFKILERSENNISLRCIGADGNSWYTKLVAVD